jgi:hypothetical protein
MVPHLVELRLARNRLSSLKGLMRMPRLEVLDVRGNRISDHRGLASLISMPSLKVFDMAHNPMTQNKGYREEVAARIGNAETALLIDGKKPDAKKVRVAQANLIK